MYYIKIEILCKRWLIKISGFIVKNQLYSMYKV